MGTGLVFLLVILNFGISWFNAWATGRSWAETKMKGGWARFMAWCGAIMSACGFTWVYLIIGGLIANSFGYLDAAYLSKLFSLGYLAIILPVIGTGIAITVDSWMTAWRERSFLSGGVAAWNTFSTGYNIYQATSAIPKSLGDVGDLFDSDESPMAKLVILIAIFAIAGGILTTTAIVRKTAAKYAHERLKMNY